MSKLLIFTLLIFISACNVSPKESGDEFIADHRQSTNSFKIKNSQQGKFVTGAKLIFTLSFPLPVIVSGIPTLSLEVGTDLRSATYKSGHNTKELIFEYTITAADNDSNGIVSKSLSLNGGSLQFNYEEQLQDCDTNLKSTHFPKIIIDNTAPAVTGLTHSYSTTVATKYYAGDSLLFHVEFSEDVIVTGSPKLPLTIGTDNVSAIYLSGSGTKRLAFRYVISMTDFDNNGIEVGSIIQNASTIKDHFGNDATLTLNNILATNFIRPDGRIPKILEVLIPSDKTYRALEELDFIVNFDRDVTVAGTPYLDLKVGTTDQRANYLQGSGTSELIFRYIPTPGHIDSDGIELTNSIIFPASSSIRSNSVSLDAFTNNLKLPDTSKILIEATNPSIIRFTRGNDTTTQAGNTTIDNVWIIGQTLNIVAEFNTKINVNINNGSPTLTLDIGGVNKTASYLSSGGNSNNISFTYVIEEGDLSTGTSIKVQSLNLNGSILVDDFGTIADLNFSEFTLTNTQVDGVRPTITNIKANDAGYYSSRTSPNQLRLEVDFSEIVYVRNNTASIDISVNGSTLAARSNTTTAAKVNYTYPINASTSPKVEGQISIPSNISLNANKILDRAGNELVVTTLPSVNTTTIFYDNVSPTASLSSQPSSKTYFSGEDLIIELSFPEPVTISYSGTSVSFRINNLSTTAYFTPDFVSGSESKEFKFKYTVGADHVATTNIALNTLSGLNSIIDRALNPLTLTGSNLSLTNNIKVDGRTLKVNSSSISDEEYLTLGKTLEIDLTFSHAITITGTPYLRATKDGVNYDFSYSTKPNSTTARFIHTITNESLRTEGIGSISSITLNGGSIMNNDLEASLAISPAVDLDSVTIFPQSFKAWAQNSLTNALDTTNNFTGSLSIVPATSASLSVPSGLNGSVFMTKMRINNDYLAGDFFEEVQYTIDPISSEIELTGPNILSVKEDSQEITPVAGFYKLLGSPGDLIKLEIEFSTNVPSTPGGMILNDNFTGSVRSLVILDGPLSNADRTKIENLMSN